MTKKPARCKTCSRQLTTWGKTSSGKKRYRCSVCGKTRIYHQTNRNNSLFSLFKQYIFNGIVFDGGTGIVSAITSVFPHTPHQICLAHMHRGIISAIGRYSKDYRVQELRRLADLFGQWIYEFSARF